MGNKPQGRQVLIACAMIRKELEYLMERTPFSGEVVWMDKGLHEKPGNLLHALREEIGRRDAPDTDILLAYGLCGNGVIGLKAEHARLVVPAFDDCLRILLSEEPGKPILCNPRALLYTDGWMDREDGLLTKREKYIARYGEKKGRKILHLMLKNYEEIMFLDTGLYDVAACMEEIRPAAAELSLRITQCGAHLRAYEKFLAGEWDGEFIVTAPGETITEAHFDTRARCYFPDREPEAAKQPEEPSA